MKLEEHHMNYLRYIIWATFTGVFAGMFLYSPTIYAGQVVTCKQFVEQREHRCVIQIGEDEDVLEGDQAILYSPRDFYWVATGKVIVVKGSYLVAAFREANPKIHKGLEVVLETGGHESVLSWSLAFSKPDLPGKAASAPIP